MEDEDYYDEFGDDEEMSPLKDDQAERERERERESDDEQQRQKLTAQLESLQQTLQKREEESEQTQIKLAEALVKIEELIAKNSSLASAKRELEEAREQINDLKEELKQAKKTPPPAAVSPSPVGQSYERLKKTFVQVSHQHNLDTVDEIEEMNESICISLLQQLSKKFQQEKQLKKSPSSAPSPSMANASDSELQQRITNLEEELRLALGAAEDIRALKAKAISLVERIRLEKEEKLRCEAEQKVFIKKIEMLSDHVEKLMIHLKHEAAAKIKAIDQLRASEKRNESAQLQLGIISRKVAAKDRLIAELREGSKILEDQLRLMDEKYLELRTKLDYAREVAAKKVKIAQKTASDLRVKFALAGNTKLLDHMPLPDINSSNTNGMGDFQLSENDFTRSMPNFSQSMMMTSPSPQPLRSMNSSNNLLKPSTTGGMGMSNINTSLSGNGSNTREKKKSKKKSQTIAKDTEQSTERVLDKIRRLRGGQQDWTDEKIRKLVKSH